MKKYLAMSVLTLSTAQALQVALPDQEITCRMQMDKTERFVANELEKHPEAVGQFGDDGAIVVSEVEGFTLRIENKEVSGTFRMGNTEEDMNRDNEHTSRSIESLVKKEDGRLLLTVDESGWDNFNYAFTIDPNFSRGFLAESFDYDCGGDGSLAYGVYVCTVKELN